MLPTWEWRTRFSRKVGRVVTRAPCRVRQSRKGHINEGRVPQLHLCVWSDCDHSRRRFLKVLVVGFSWEQILLPIKMVLIKINSPEDMCSVVFSHGHLPKAVRKWLLFFSKGLLPWAGYFFPNIINSSNTLLILPLWGEPHNCWALIILCPDYESFWMESFV